MKKRQSTTHINYWESATDAIVGLMMVVLLCLLLMMLIMQISHSYENNSLVDNEKPYDYAYTESDIETDYHHEADMPHVNSNRIHDYDDDEDEGEHRYSNPVDRREREHDGGGAGNGGGEWNGQYEYENQGIDEGNRKCAVLVQVVDEDTRRQILEKDITFEIRNKNNELVTLSTHYPEKIDYQHYETNERGQFYLPEKVYANQYFFYQLSDVQGYDRSDGVLVEILEERDWDDPELVIIPLSPSRNTVRVHMTDEDGSAIVGSVGVYAKTDIVTFDGTLRFREGELADIIELDTNGYGESTELYLGDYTLTVLSIPEEYAEVEPGEVSIGKKAAGQKNELHEIVLPFTTIHLTLRDVYSGTRIRNAAFTLTAEGKTQSRMMRTDDQGELLIRGLNRNTTYHLKQLPSENHYYAREDEIKIVVDEKGFIDGETACWIEAEDYRIRCTISLRDALLRKSVTGSLIELYRNEQLVDRWKSDDVHMIEGVEPGVYMVHWQNKTYTIEVKDTDTLQRFFVPVWSVADIVLIALLAVFVCTVLFLVLVKALKKGGVS